MNVVVSEGNSNRIPFPKLMVNISDTRHKGMIVLFTQKREGTVIKDGDNCNMNQIHAFDWNMDHFKDFHGSITMHQ